MLAAILNQHTAFMKRVLQSTAIIILTHLSAYLFVQSSKQDTANSVKFPNYLRFDLWLYIVLLLLTQTATGQTVECKLPMISDSLYSGSCRINDSLLFTINLKSGTKKTNFALYGHGTLKNRSDIGNLFLKTDGDSGILATTFYVNRWFKVYNLILSAKEISFNFDFSRLNPPSENDVAILRRTAQYLSDSTKWDRNDNRVNGRGACPLNSEKLTLFCALNKASVDILGGFFGGWSFQTLGESIWRIGEQAQHPMQSFNNDPKTTFNQLRAVLEDAIKRLTEQVQRLK
ncbi:hypothetical protein CAP36_13985 [Chitinophagaceae bacterium IBVUCB2]|nr:hypothetical protein CAP36_13985 [Chitinophagaceae bacterium IBVUCB2]